MGIQSRDLHPTQEQILSILGDVGEADSRLLVYRINSERDDEDDAVYRQLVNYHLRRLHDEEGLVETVSEDNHLYRLAHGGVVHVDLDSDDLEFPSENGGDNRD